MGKPLRENGPGEGESVAYYDIHYARHESEVYAEIRRQACGQDVDAAARVRPEGNRERRDAYDRGGGAYLPPLRPTDP